MTARCTRRTALRAAGSSLALATFGWRTAGAGESASTTGRGGPPEIERALDRASKFLVDRQSPDGAWRSDVYAQFKGGDALTPLVLQALNSVAADGQAARLDAGRRFLAGLIDGNHGASTPRTAVAYSVYTAAGAVIVLSSTAEARWLPARDAWLAYLRARQLNAKLGWRADDRQFGGWGYASDPPRRPGPGVPLAPLAEPNLSATTQAMAALVAAGMASHVTEMQDGLRFVVGCQNAALDAPGDGFTAEDNAFDDGGFFFVAEDEVRNKAGLAGTDHRGQRRFASYGSATADGLRALLLGGAKADDPRVRLAREWLMRNFTAEAHPGRYVPAREAARAAPYFYYCHSLALVIEQAEFAPQSTAVRRRWARALAESLVARQQADGSWVNAAVDVREDDPLVATSLAVETLAVCRTAVARAE